MTSLTVTPHIAESPAPRSSPADVSPQLASVPAPSVPTTRKNRLPAGTPLQVTTPESQLRRIASEPDWSRQIEMWRQTDE